MLEVTVVAECNHINMLHIESALEAASLEGKEIVCASCRRKSKIKKVGVPGRIPEDKPKNGEGQIDMFKEL